MKRQANLTALLIVMVPHRKRHPIGRSPNVVVCKMFPKVPIAHATRAGGGEDRQKSHGDSSLHSGQYQVTYSECQRNR
jgi:hypothetical protein